MTELAGDSDTNIKTSLYPYQREDVDWLSNHTRCILGSEMGTGKTVEVLALAEKLELVPVLIICPKSLISEWEYQIKQWLGPQNSRFLVLNYEKLRRIDTIHALNEIPWSLIAFDECHKLKNPKAKQTQGAFLITANGSRTILMSGTPMQNGPQDIFSLLKIVDHKLFPSYQKFIEHFCYIQQLPKPPYPRIIVGARNLVELKTLLQSHLLRREKKEVLPYLPPKIERTIPVLLEAKQRHKYLLMEEELFTILDSGERVSAPAVLAQMLRLRQICLEPNLLSEVEKVSTPSTKTQLILDLMEEAESQVVIFTYFEKYTRILSQELAKAKVSHLLYTGACSIADRTRAVQLFQEGKCKALIGTITSMGLGLNLTAANTVIFADWWFNPAVNQQATDRLHRIGQEEPVTVIDLWAKDTIEDAMHRIIKRKQKMFNEVISNEATINELRNMRR